MSMSRALSLFGLVATADAGCGAWEYHQHGIPVDQVPPPAKCTANPNCPANPGADCCPPPGANLSFNMGLLDCCNTFACECKLHPQCVYEKKTGMCCPNDKGVYDPCCSNFRAAVNNPACVKAGVKGNSCPDEHGKYHDCCHQSAKCSYQNQCPGLAGDCCPTPGGVMLGCCKKKGAAEVLALSEQQEQHGEHKQACTTKACLDARLKANEQTIKKYVPKEYQNYALADAKESYAKEVAALENSTNATNGTQEITDVLELSAEIACTNKTCLDSRLEAHEKDIKKYVPKEYQHYALEIAKKEYNKKLAALGNTTNGTNGTNGTETFEAILTPLHLNAATSYGAAFCIVFVMGVAVGVGLRRSRSAPSNAYHSMN